MPTASAFVVSGWPGTGGCFARKEEENGLDGPKNGKVPRFCGGPLRIPGTVCPARIRYAFARGCNSWPHEHPTRRARGRIWRLGAGPMARAAPCAVSGTASPRARAVYYRCNQCREDFTVRTGTIFERSHVPLHKWLYAMYLLVTARKGISSMQLSKEIGITQKSAWAMKRRLEAQ